MMFLLHISSSQANENEGHCNGFILFKFFANMQIYVALFYLDKLFFSSQTNSDKLVNILKNNL